MTRYKVNMKKTENVMITRKNVIMRKKIKKYEQCL